MERAEFDRELDGLLSEAEGLIPEERAEPLPESSGVPGWRRFEDLLWGRGEQIRQLILATGKKPNSIQLQRICAICTDVRGGRGRQSFVLLLGKNGYASFAPVIANLLTDSDVEGQAVDTLYKMRVMEYGAEVLPFTEHRHTWIRNIAKKYMALHDRTPR